MKKLYKVGLFRLYEQKNKWKWSYIDIFILFVLLIYSEDNLRGIWSQLDDFSALEKEQYY